MTVLIAHLKHGLGGLNVYKAPGGHKVDWRDAIEPTVWMQPIGPTVKEDKIDWLEVTYARTRERPQRGWVRKDLLDIMDDPKFPDASVHEKQVAYEKSISFPKPPDIPRFDREFMPETDPIMSRRGFWLLVCFGGLVVAVFLAKLFLHIS